MGIVAYCRSRSCDGVSLLRNDRNTLVGAERKRSREKTCGASKDVMLKVRRQEGASSPIDVDSPGDKGKEDDQARNKPGQECCHLRHGGTCREETGQVMGINREGNALLSIKVWRSFQRFRVVGLNTKIPQPLTPKGAIARKALFRMVWGEYQRPSFPGTNYLQQHL